MYVRTILNKDSMWIKIDALILLLRKIMQYLTSEVIDYFLDIDRLKEFAEIPEVNDTKIYAYTSCRVLKQKPLQVVSMQDAKNYVFCGLSEKYNIW